MKLQNNARLYEAIRIEVKRLIQEQRRAKIVEASYDLSKMTNTEKARLLRKVRDDMRGTPSSPPRDEDKVQVISGINMKRMAVFQGLDRRAQNRISHALRDYKFMWRGVSPGTPVTFEGSEAQIIQHIKDQYRKVGQSF